MTHRYLLILALLPFSVTAQEKPVEPTDMVTISDNFLQSAVAAKTCSPPDASTEKAFLANLVTVTTRKGQTLKERYPQLSEKELLERDNARNAVVKSKAEDYIKKHGCDSEEVKALLKMYGLHAKWNPYSPAPAAQEAIPAEFSSVAVDAANSYEFVTACIPSMSESTFNQNVRVMGEKKTIVSRPGDKTKPYLVMTKGRAYCIRMSAQKHPVLPLAVFDDTINFPDMPKDEVRRLRTDLSRQLAISGFASALVIYDKGNATQVLYMFGSEMPTLIYYQANYLKKGEFAESNFTSVYRTPGASMSMISRGPSNEDSSEFFKRFFQDIATNPYGNTDARR